MPLPSAKALANLEIVSSLIRLKDGSLTTSDQMNAERIPWRDPWPTINGHPQRKKICPRCWRYLKIAAFLLDSDVLRTIVKVDAYENEIALPVSEVAEHCKECRNAVR